MIVPRVKVNVQQEHWPARKAKGAVGEFGHVSTSIFGPSLFGKALGAYCGAGLDMSQLGRRHCCLNSLQLRPF